LENNSKQLFEFFERQIEEHNRRVDPDSDPTDFVEAFLREKAKKEENGEFEDNYS
jgi:hypothetical protein